MFLRSSSKGVAASELRPGPAPVFRDLGKNSKSGRPAHAFLGNTTANMTTVDDLAKDLAGTLALPPNSGSSSGKGAGSQNASATGDSRSGTVPAPALPPAMVAASSPAAVLEEMEKHPLFMQSLSGQEDNPELEALKALAYEGTPAEVAENFVNQGNEAFREKRWKDAVEFYSKAVSALVGAEVERRKKRQGKSSAGSKAADKKQEDTDDAKEEEKEKALIEKALTNRAAGNLELKNYRQTKIDTIAVLKSNPSNLKASYRLAKAHFSLDHVPEALKAVEFGIQQSQNTILGTKTRGTADNDLKAIMNQNTALEKLKVQIVARQEVLDKRERERREKEDQEKRREAALAEALKARKIPVIKTPNPPSDVPDTIKLSLADPLDSKSELLFPTTILYPLTAQSDLISAFPGSSSLQDQLAQLLDPGNPPPWDAEKKEYTVGAVDCFMLDIKGEGLIKVGKKMPLLDVLGSNAVRGVVDGFVAVMVVPRSEEGKKWKEGFRERNKR